MQKTFLFYDIETSGLNPAFDQIIQFAAIRTDERLNELERYDWVIKPSPDVVPSPAAMMTHRTPLSIWQKGEPEFMVIKRIHELLNTPGTMSIGYNSFGFDDEFLRFSFYRNLLSPYTHQYDNLCSRGDVYPITALYYLFHSNILTWPTRNEKISLKLESLNDCNSLATGVAHTAMVDIEATIALAKIFMQRLRTWDYALGYFDKTEDSARQKKLPVLFGKKYAIAVDGIFGADANFCAPLLWLGEHYHYKNQSCWLRLDTETLSHVTPQEVSMHTWAINKKLAEPGFLLPASERYQQKLSETKKNVLKKNISWLDNNPEILSVIKEYYCEFTYPKYENIAPEAALYYQGFWSSQEKFFAQKFHEAPHEKKTTVIDNMTSSVLKTLAIHALARIDQRLLSVQQHDLWMEHLAYAKTSPEKVIDHKGKRKLSVDEGLAQLEALLDSETVDAEQKSLLQELKKFFQV
ncbi:MAG: exodeoxyribonuclease I [Gammaproteobacteria bacterium]|nr:exodeoxyribonuclease I [Gammaproteobacteria bacterium]MCD8542634.1 exodeoxyribonuclease I [Gammaproteobacteria bacterium]